MNSKTVLSCKAALLLASGLSLGLASLADAAPIRRAASHSVRSAVRGPDAIPMRRQAGVADLPSDAGTPGREIRISVGEGQIINLPAGVANVWISNPSAADVYISSLRQIQLYGKASGETNLFATTASGAVIFSAVVRTTPNVHSLDAMIKAAMPDANITVTHVGNIAVMTGTVKSPEESAQAEQIVKMLLNPGASSGPNDSLKNPVFNRLQTATPMQVNLQVRFAEVSRSFVKSLSSSFQTIDGTDGIKYAIGQGRSSTYNSGGPLGVNGSAVARTLYDPVTGLPIGSIPGTSVAAGGANATTMALAGKLFGLNILEALDAGEGIGLVSTISQPNLTALSGETANFLAGGEFPIPISQGLGSTGIEFKPYGVNLTYTPTVLSGGRILIRVNSEVSEISSQGAVSIGGFQIPATTTRRAETSVELGSGQSFMIAGLMSNNTNNAIQKMPGAGDVPILGVLFRSTNFRRGETELVIVITPYLVKPVSASEIKLPTDGYSAPNELQRILGHVAADGKTGASRPMPRAAEPKAPDPKIGMLEQAPVAAPAPSAPARGAETPPAKRDGQAHLSDAPSPGFSLN